MNANDPNQVRLLILSIHQEMGENFAKELCGEQGTTCQVEGRKVTVDVLAGDPRLNAAWDETIRNAGGIAVLTRFLDVISLDKIKAIYRRIPSDTPPPTAIITLRDNGETDFKMSCPVCGQKLWVRDGDAGKRGRCPNCKKAFTLPDQVNHLRAQLALPDSVPVIRVASGQPGSALAAMEQLLKPLSDGLIERPEGIDQDVLKQSTIRVQINPDEI
jgi:predicted RNA-binding Zn-ribbon protein involved in translation (DUF1610 family)